jgi:PIN domain nuclease of toxin-antitoxin system
MFLTWKPDFFTASKGGACNLQYMGLGADGRPMLFDTQAVIQWAAGTVPKAVYQRVTEGYAVSVSVVSNWEMILKPDASLSYEQFLETMESLDAALLPVQLPHLEMLRHLPFIGDHRDPFDHMIIAQAIHRRRSTAGDPQNMILVGGDRIPGLSQTKSKDARGVVMARLCCYI